MENTFLIPEEIIEREIATAAGLKEAWERRLAELKATGRYRMRINATWETNEQAAARIQALIDSYAVAIERISAFRALYPASDT